jgi:murein DD-endopeptidase MepM/ murein hydrolase activator NlpD
MDGRLPLVVALAALGLQGCGRQAPVTVVTAPRTSLPDDTVLRPGAQTAPTPPAAAADSPGAGPPSAPVTGSAPDTAAQAATTPLPQVREPGDAMGAELLARRPLQMPVAGIPPASLSDQYTQGRAGHTHEAIDILAPAGTPVVAVDDGRITKLFTSKPGGLTVYQYDPQGRLAYYYAHLQRYADGLHEGMDVKRGQVVGYVGSSGNADARVPHLHFAVFRLGTPARWWEGEAVNPYPALSRAQVTAQVASR